MSADRGRATVSSGAALAVCLLLSACAGIPDSSPPRVIEAVPSTGVTEEPDVRFQPRSPQPGQTAGEVVAGFLDAETSPEQQHGVARQFLTASAAATWRDDAGAAVLASPPTLAERNGVTAEVAVRGTQIATVDARGSYTPLPTPRQSYTYRLELVRVNGAWRIANPPSGLIMTESAFRQAYRRLNIYFLARNESRVVPDPRWFSAPRDALPNLLMKVLLDGPAVRLADAVRTELAGASLSSNVVPEADRVRVFLAGLQDREADAEAAASAQIVWTLDQLAAPAVEIYNDGQPVTPRGTGPVQYITDWRTYDPDALPLYIPGYFIRDGAVWTADGKPAQGPAGLGAYHALAVGVSIELSRIAVVGRLGDGAALYVGGAGRPLSLRLRAASLAPPSWDPISGSVWTVRDGSQILRIPPVRGQPVQVLARELDRGLRISTIRLSRDGSRAAVLMGPPGQESLYVGAVTAGGSNVVELQPIAPQLAMVRDVSWASADTLVVVATGANGIPAIYSVGVDGSLEKAFPPYGLPATPPTAVAAAPGQPTLALASGRIWRLSDLHSTWTAVPPTGHGPTESRPAYPG